MTNFPLSTPRSSGIVGVFLWIVVSTIGTAPAAADPIKLTFTALVTESTGPAELVFGLPVVVGDSISGTFTFDRVRTPDCSNCSFSFGAPYGMFIDAGTGLTLDGMITASWFGGFGFGEGYDFYALNDTGPYNPREPFTRHTLITGELRFRDPASDFSPTGFPENFAVLAGFPLREFEVIATADNDRDFGNVTPYDFAFGGVITAVDWALAPAPVPESGTLGLLGLAIGAALATSRTIRDRLRRK